MKELIALGFTARRPRSLRQGIDGQDKHHRKIGFQDELRALLRKHEIEWDEKYVWD